MSRLRQRPQDDPVTLLPFLAVLICTMGALIVLLVVVVQQARIKGSEVVDSETPAIATDPPLAPPTNEPIDVAAPNGPTSAEVSQAQQERDKYLWEIRLLAESREQTLQRLSEKRLELSHLEEHTRSLATQLDQLQQEARQSAAELGQSDDAIQAELARVEQQIATTKDVLESARIVAAARRDTFQLIPYTGSRGTTRRPIYVECLPNAVIIRPEGVRLDADDFTLARSAGNPLAAALRAVREYWAATEGDTERGEPYPLLVVRPGGETAYGACRQALRSWDDEFGYELVPADVDLSYPPADPQLASAIEHAIELSRQQQRQLKGFLAIQDSGGPVYRASRRNGGFVREGGSSNANGRPSFSGSRFSGTSASGSSAFGQNPVGSRSPGATTFGSSATGSESVASSSPDSASFGSGTADLETGGSSSRSSTAFDTSSAGSESVVSSPTDPTLFGSGTAGSEFEGSSSPDSTSLGSNTSGTDATGLPSSQWSLPGSPGQAGTAPLAAPGGENSRNGQAVANSPPTDGDQPIHDRASSFMPAPLASSAAGSSSSLQPFPPLAPPSTEMNTAPANPPPASLATTRGRDWALPNAARGAIPIRRPLYVTVDNALLVLEAEPGTNETPQNITFGDSAIAAVQSMVTTIWKRIDNWGVAGPGVYWKPTMEVAVQPDGEARFRELAALLQNSGIDVVRR